MTALQQLQQPGPPIDEMARLHHAGFSLVPLGRGDDGKSPMLAFQGKPRLPLGRVLAPMHRTGSTCYGIRLDGLAVIDCDEDDPALVNQMEARFGASPVHVRTPRGRHLYYKAEGKCFPNLRKEGLPVDIKRGASSYVMGPQSVRPDGGAYIPAKGRLGEVVLPTICEPKGNPPARARGASAHVAEGSRNYALTVAAIQMVESVDDPDELFGNLQFMRDDQCDDPETVPDGELQKIADWAWSCRLEGKVYQGRNSEFRVHREALDALKALPNAAEAIALFVVLQDQHGHVPGRRFPLDHERMSAAGHTNLSRRRFLEARRALEEAGLLRIAHAHRAAHHRRTYQLARISLLTAETTNVAELRPAKGGGV